MNYLMQILKNSSQNFFQNLILCFSGTNLLWQLLAFVLTYISVVTGFDWLYFEFFGHGWILHLLISAAIVGFFVPFLLPLFLLIRFSDNKKILNVTFALIQSEFLAWLISIFYKFFTGRAHPVLFLPTDDLSHTFRFGLFRGGVFWGWPSSHTIVAFAMAMVLFKMYPESKIIKYSAWIYAFYIGLGVSISVHWFSDFVAGAIIGTIVGDVVANSFKRFNYV